MIDSVSTSIKSLLDLSAGVACVFWRALCADCSGDFPSDLAVICADLCVIDWDWLAADC